MEFKFKRKYTGFFFLAVFLLTIVISFWVLAPQNIFGASNAKQLITSLGFANSALILILYLGLLRKKYFAYYDKLTIKRSLFKTLTIEYNSIKNIKEKENDTIFLIFGQRPSFKIYYTNKNGKEKKYTVRTDNNKLLLKVIRNEISIANLNNTKR